MQKWKKCQVRVISPLIKGRNVIPSSIVKYLEEKVDKRREGKWTIFERRRGVQEEILERDLYYTETQRENQGL